MPLKNPIYKLFFLFCLCFSFVTKAQLVINEVSGANDSILKDQNGKYPDWIELYNTGTSVIDLENYSLTRRDDETNIKWTFPKAVIKPKKHFSVFASGNNVTTMLDHWEVPVYAANPWKYFVGTTQPPLTWWQSTFNDAAWPTGVGPIGYNYPGLGVTTPTTISLFMRKSFVVADTARIKLAAVFAYIDDGFVAYLNNVEIARYNLGVYSDHPLYNVYAYDPSSAAAPLIFLVPKQALVQGTNVLTIQTHNAQISTNNMFNNFNLLFGIGDTTVVFPSFPITDVQLQTNFTLPSRGEKLILSDPAGTIIDEQFIEPVQVNHSRGRMPDGNNTWCLFGIPTPNDTNAFSSCYSGYAKQPKLSLKPGFYSGTQSVIITSNPPSNTIHYTRDGSVPTFTSPLYTSAINIDSTQVIKARDIAGGLILPGETTVGTYFINENISLPVVSVSTNPENLWDYFKGIYVKGPGADTVWPYLGANFWQGWSRLGQTEFFDENGNFGFELTSAIEIQGNYSKGFPQKGFCISANDDYGEGAINYPIFPNKKAIKKYKSFNIRNAGSDWNTCHMRDRLNHKAVEKTHVDYMDSRPCVMFLNGQYWGVYELREKQDADYIENNHDVKKENFDLLRFNGDAMQGTNAGFLNMVSFFNTKDVSIQSNYDSAMALIDYENYVDYYATETFIANWDWIYPDKGYANNIKFWRISKPPGKWRYVLWDTDVSTALIPSMMNYTINTLAPTINPPLDNPHSDIFRSLLKNTEFKNYFVNRYADLLNTVFEPNKFSSLAYKLSNDVAPEMTRHFLKWNQPIIFGPIALGSSTNVATWQNAIGSMVSFIVNRTSTVRYHIQSQFALPQQVQVNLDTYPNEGGTIKMNTIYPDLFPWSGIYYDGVPVTMTAIPNPGYKFMYWTTNKHTVNDKEASVKLNIVQPDLFTAHFEKTEIKMEAFPNPFSNNVTITYELTSNVQASIKLYSILGAEVATLVSDDVFSEEGNHSFQLNAQDYTLSPGVYLLTYKTGDFTKTIKLVLSR